MLQNCVHPWQSLCAPWLWLAPETAVADASEMTWTHSGRGPCLLTEAWSCLGSDLAQPSFHAQLISALPFLSLGVHCECLPKHFGWHVAVVHVFRSHGVWEWSPAVLPCFRGLISKSSVSGALLALGSRCLLFGGPQHSSLECLWGEWPVSKGNPTGP